MRFTPAPVSTMDRDMIQIKRAVGGKTGTLSEGNSKTGTVLKLDDNLYVTTDKSAKRFKTMAEIQKSDIHILSSQADIAYFVERYTLYNRGKR